MVILWSPARLAAALQARTLREGEKFNLLVAGLILSSLFGFLGSATSLDRKAMFVASILGLVVYFAGLFAAFRANQRGDGICFVERLVCLIFPLSFRVLGSVTVGYWLLAVMTADQWNGLTSASAGGRVQWQVIWLVASVIFWAKLRKYIAIASSPPAA